MGRGRSRNWNAVPTPPTPPQQWYQQHTLYQHLPDSVPLSWQQGMGTPGPMRMPSHVSIPRANFVTPFQQPNQAQAQLSNNWWQMPVTPFVPLQADKKMRKARGENAEKPKESPQKETPPVVQTKPVKETVRSSTSLPMPTNEQTTQRKSRIAAKFMTPINENSK